jgi:hypothetical protein
VKSNNIIIETFTTKNKILIFEEQLCTVRPISIFIFETICGHKLSVPMNLWPKAESIKMIAPHLNSQEQEQLSLLSKNFGFSSFLSYFPWLKIKM